MLAALLVSSCACDLGDKASGLADLQLQLKRSESTNKKARTALSAAMKEVELAQADAQAAHALVDEMANQDSPFTGEVEMLRSSYEARILELQIHIEATNAALQQQWEELELTKEQLQYANNELALAKRQTKSVQKRNLSLMEDKERIEDERDEWKLKHAKLAKYRWAVVGTIAIFALGVVAKFRGILF